MTVFAVFLRGINVGGRNKLPMARLRELAASCGYDQVKTYIQSGNVVLTTRADGAAEVAAELGAAISGATGLGVPVTARTREQLIDAAATSPFSGQSFQDEFKHVMFLDDASVDVDIGVQIDSLSGFEPEQAELIGREIHLYLPGGVARSKLLATVARLAGKGATTRNWKTFNKMIEMTTDIAMES